MRLFCIENRQATFIDAFVTSAREHSFQLELIRPSQDAPSSFAKFKRLYRHLSVNSQSFELACFRRYFEIAKTVQDNERFIIADSDLLINSEPSEIPLVFKDQANALVGSIGRTDGIPEGDISPHFSFWTKPLIQRFVEFLIHIYESQDARLEHTYQSRQSSGNKRAAISDMTLLKMFTQDDSVAFIDSNQVVDGFIIDHNLSMAQSINTTFRMSLGFKSFRRQKQKIIFITRNNEEVRPLALHLQGRAKVAALPLLNGNDLSARLRLGSVSAARFARKWLP